MHGPASRQWAETFLLFRKEYKAFSQTYHQIPPEKAQTIFYFLKFQNSFFLNWKWKLNDWVFLHFPLKFSFRHNLRLYYYAHQIFFAIFFTSVAYVCKKRIFPRNSLPQQQMKYNAKHLLLFRVTFAGSIVKISEKSQRIIK